MKDSKGNVIRKGSILKSPKLRHSKGIRCDKMTATKAIFRVLGRKYDMSFTQEQLTDSNWVDWKMIK